nr:MAG TPA: hypothetical protein [Bacteriophage sp.]
MFYHCSCTENKNAVKIKFGDSLTASTHGIY